MQLPEAMNADHHALMLYPTTYDTQQIYYVLADIPKLLRKGASRQENS